VRAADWSTGSDKWKSAWSQLPWLAIDTSSNISSLTWAHREKLPITSWIETNWSLFTVLVLSEGPCSDSKQFPVHYINMSHLAFANLCPIAPDERDRWSFPRSSMAFRNTRILPRYSPLQFEHRKISRAFRVFVTPYWLHWVSGMMEVEVLLRSSALQLNDTGNIEDQTRSL